jgi:hypothetical protein
MPWAPRGPGGLLIGAGGGFCVSGGRQSVKTAGADLVVTNPLIICRFDYFSFFVVFLLTRTMFGVIM